MLQPKGIIPAMITPLTESGQINESILRQQVQRLVSANVHGLFCLGTNGEFYALTVEEKLRVAEIVIAEANGQVPVYVGAGDISTSSTVRLAQTFERMGADAVSVITPYFLTYSQRELIEHYRAVADSTSLPIVLYNIPARTANLLQPKSVAELSKVPNIVGIKDSSGSYDNIVQYLDAVDGSFAVLAGTDSLILSTLMSGGTGAVAATANVFPQLLVDIYDTWQKGDCIAAEHLQKQLHTLRALFQLGTLPSVLKAFMDRMGLMAGPPRLPVARLTGAEQEELERVYQNYCAAGLLPKLEAVAENRS